MDHCRLRSRRVWRSLYSTPSIVLSTLLPGGVFSVDLEKIPQTSFFTPRPCPSAPEHSWSIPTYDIFFVEIGCHGNEILDVTMQTLRSIISLPWQPISTKKNPWIHIDDLYLALDSEGRRANSSVRIFFEKKFKFQKCFYIHHRCESYRKMESPKVQTNNGSR